MKATELREAFLKDHAEKVMSLYRDRLDGNFPKDCDISALDKMWELLEKIVIGVKDKETLDATSTQSVLDALKKGKITVDQAKELMFILKLQSDVDGTGMSTVESHKMFQIVLPNETE